MTPLEIVQQTAPLINEAGNRFYFHPDTLARGKELGLDGFRFYFLGRGGVLGDVEPAVIGSAFGDFSPGVVETIWSSAKQIMAPRDAARAYLACADQFGMQQLDGLDVLDSIASVDCDFGPGGERSKPKERIEIKRIELRPRQERAPAEGDGNDG